MACRSCEDLIQKNVDLKLVPCLNRETHRCCQRCNSENIPLEFCLNEYRFQCNDCKEDHIKMPSLFSHRRIKVPTRCAILYSVHGTTEPANYQYCVQCLEFDPDMQHFRRDHRVSKLEDDIPFIREKVKSNVVDCEVLISKISGKKKHNQQAISHQSSASETFLSFNKQVKAQIENLCSNKFNLELNLCLYLHQFGKNLHDCKSDHTVIWIGPHFENAVKEAMNMNLHLDSSHPCDMIRQWVGDENAFSRTQPNRMQPERNVGITQETLLEQQQSQDQGFATSYTASTQYTNQPNLCLQRVPGENSLSNVTTFGGMQPPTRRYSERELIQHPRILDPASFESAGTTTNFMRLGNEAYSEKLNPIRQPTDDDNRNREGSPTSQEVEMVNTYRQIEPNNMQFDVRPPPQNLMEEGQVQELEEVTEDRREYSTSPINLH